MQYQSQKVRKLPEKSQASSFQSDLPPKGGKSNFQKPSPKQQNWDQAEADSKFLEETDLKALEDSSSRKQEEDSFLIPRISEALLKEKEDA
mmetsp:Transcript_10101/g.17054  ORF Transcript_10101/g.17054 Transcript_10101/m.17054 type:complete len:91 (-) Transcript_10101:445-717(-)